MESKNARKRELRNFGLSLGVVCLLWGGLFRWKGHGDAALWFAVAGPVLVLAAVIEPRVLFPLHRVWMPAARGIARAITWILLAGAYYLVITPVGFVRRKRSPETPPDGSGWIARDDTPFDPKSMDRQY
ncbi:MAG: SxtJ family membrane protein [Gemmatimonadota bacterium]|nr:SxtJ family membrane protein [Gemmatimonadota bacterium]MDP6801697.1 SxtJ family membrane protein [Gemmatimonadota bacterium]MDP7031227.1 SxtJ family membrane protein [Gemmatimonadota bacterium]